MEEYNNWTMSHDGWGVEKKETPVQKGPEMEYIRIDGHTTIKPKSVRYEWKGDIKI